MKFKFYYGYDDQLRQVTKSSPKDVSEFWPVYTADIPKEVIEEWKRTKSEFEKATGTIQSLINKQLGPPVREPPFMFRVTSG